MNVFLVIGSSIGVTKLINKTGQKQIMMDITEFKANAFLSDRNALDNKNGFALERRKCRPTSNKLCHPFLTSRVSKPVWLTFFCGIQKKTFCRMLPNHFAYPTVCTKCLEFLKLTFVFHSWKKFIQVWNDMMLSKIIIIFFFGWTIPLRTLIFVNNTHLIYIRHWYLSLIMLLPNQHFTSKPIRTKHLKREVLAYN